MMPMSKRSPKRTGGGRADLREIIELHAHATRKYVLLQDEYRALAAGGKRAAARDALERMEKLLTVIRALEAQVKQSPDA
jgi:hypothetical protein